MQTRSETWTRQVITQPTNGGTACGLLIETRTGTQACTAPPPPGANTPPTISVIPDQTVSKNTRTLGPLPFAIGDVQTVGGSPDADVGHVYGIARATGWHFVWWHRRHALSYVGFAFWRERIGRRQRIGDRWPRDNDNAVFSHGWQCAEIFETGAEKSHYEHQRQPIDRINWSDTSESSLDPAAVDSSLDADATAGDPRSTLQGYRIELGAVPGSESVGSFTTGVTRQFTIRFLPPGQYYIRVRGVHPDGETEASNEVMVTVSGGPGSAGAPRELRVTLTGRIADIRWEPPDGAPNGYVLEAGTAWGQSNLTRLQIARGSIVTPELPDGIYYVRVKSLKGGTTGPPSTELVFSVTSSPSCTGSPRAPASLSAITSGSRIQLTWSPSTGASLTSYLLEAGSAPGRRNLGTLTLDPSTTTLSAPVPNGTYFIRVTAVNGCGASLPSQTVSITVGGQCPSSRALQGVLLRCRARECH